MAKAHPWCGSHPFCGDQPMYFCVGNRHFTVCLGMVTFVACLCAAPAPPEPPKPKDGPLGMKFVPLPKGTFYMGWDSEKKKSTKTEIKADFEIAVYTVTQGQWQELMGNNPS